MFYRIVKSCIFVLTKSGCSSVRLEHTSGGRGAGGSNPLTPTEGVQAAPFFMGTENKKAASF